MESFIVHQHQIFTYALPKKLTHVNSWRKELLAITNACQNKKSKCRDQDKQNTKHIKTKVTKGKGKGQAGMLPRYKVVSWVLLHFTNLW